jgi:hypothetical protein
MYVYTQVTAAYQLDLSMLMEVEWDVLWNIGNAIHTDPSDPWEELIVYKEWW